MLDTASMNNRIEFFKSEAVDTDLGTSYQLVSIGKRWARVRQKSAFVQDQNGREFTMVEYTIVARYEPQLMETTFIKYKDIKLNVFHVNNVHDLNDELVIRATKEESTDFGSGGGDDFGNGGGHFGNPLDEPDTPHDHSNDFGNGGFDAGGEPGDGSSDTETPGPGDDFGGGDFQGGF